MHLKGVRHTGDYLLARASVALARLRNPDAIELLSIVIEHLVKGEIMQLKNQDAGTSLKNIEYYLTKSFYKTASLLANSCKACAVLAGMCVSRALSSGFAIMDGSRMLTMLPCHRDES